MTQPLFVDTSRLHSAGAALRALALPDPPARITATGSDPVSAAINATMPAIEAPVLEGLPAVQAVLTKTAAAMVTAAAMYAQTDQLMSMPLLRAEIPAGREPSVAGAGEHRPGFGALGDVPRDQAAKDGPVRVRPGEFGDLPKAVAEVTPVLNQVIGTVGSMTQTVTQSAQGTTQNSPLGEQTDDDDTEEQRAEAAEGAAPGDEQSESAPVQVADRAQSTATRAGR